MKEERLVKVEEEYALKRIPDALRRPWTYPAILYMGMCAVIACAMGGGGLISGLSFRDALIAMFIGIFILIFLFWVPLGKIGSQEGLNTYKIGECAYGRVGTNIVTSLVVTALPTFGWYGVEVAIAAQAFAGAFGWGTLQTNILIILFGLIFAIPAMYGFVRMVWLDYICIPIIGFIAIYGVIKSGMMLGGVAEVWSYTPPAATAFGLFFGINLMIGMIAEGCAFSPDYTRWTKNKWSEIIKGGAVGILPFTAFLGISGMIMALTAKGVTEPWNIVEVMIHLGMPAFALMLIFLLQWTTCLLAVYSSGLALKNTFGWSRFWWTFLSAIVGIIFALSGILHYFLSFLAILAAWIPAAVAVILIEYYWISHKKLNSKKGWHGIHLPGVIAWFIGGFIAYVFPTYGIPALNGMAISAAIYIAFYYGLSRYGKKAYAKI